MAKKQHRTENMVLILIILVAVGGVYYIWQANQVGPGRTVAGVRALAEIWQKRAVENVERRN